MARIKIQEFHQGGWWIQYFDTMDAARREAIKMIENPHLNTDSIWIWRGTKHIGTVEKNEYGQGYVYNLNPINKNGTIRRK